MWHGLQETVAFRLSTDRGEFRGFLDVVIVAVGTNCSSALFVLIGLLCPVREL